MTRRAGLSCSKSKKDDPRVLAGKSVVVNKLFSKIVLINSTDVEPNNNDVLVKRPRKSLEETPDTTHTAQKICLQACNLTPKVFQGDTFS